jgi:inorganic pyrophosphatase
VKAGDNPPQSINVVIEIPEGSSVKYEADLESGAIFVDRFLHTATYYPFNYGFIPQTKGTDGDPVDVLVLSTDTVYPMSVIRSRPIGVLLTEDEKGPDAKIIAVPNPGVDPLYSKINSIDKLPDFTKEQIEHFFMRYKEIEPNKFVKIHGWQGVEQAKKMIRKAIKAYDKNQKMGAKSPKKNL